MLQKKSKGLVDAMVGQQRPDPDEQRAILALREMGIEPTPKNINAMMLKQSGVITPQSVYGGNPFEGSQEGL